MQELSEKLDTLSKEFDEVSKSKYFNSKWLKNRLDPGSIVNVDTDEGLNESLLIISSIKEENLNASKSRIHDVDMAEEVVALTKKNMLSQSTRAILAQSNKKPEQIIKLLE